MDKSEVIQRLNEKLEENYAAYMQSLQGMDEQALIDRAEEIAAAKFVYDELKDGNYNIDDLEYLLRFQNPLEVVRDQWMDEQDVDYSDEMSNALWTISDRQDAEQDYELDASYPPPEQDGGVKMC